MNQRLCDWLRVQTPLLFLVLSVAGVGAFSATDNLYWRESGYSFSEIALMASVFNIGIVIAELPFAVYFDRYSNKRVLQLGNILRFLAFFIFFMNGGVEWVIFGQLLAGLGYAASSGTAEALVMNRIQDNDAEGMTRGYSRIFFWSSIATLLSGSAGILLYFVLPSLIWALAMALFAAAGLIVLMLRDERADQAPIPWTDFIKGLKSTLTLKETYLLVLANSAAVAPFILWQIKIGEVSLVLLFAGFLAMRAMGTIASPLQSRFNLGFTHLWWLLLANAAIIVLFAFTEVPYLLPVFFGVHVLAQSLVIIICYGLFHAGISNDVRASSGSVVSLLDSAIVALIAPVVGWIADHGSVSLAVALSSSMYMLMLIYLFIARIRPTKEVAPR